MTVRQAIVAGSIGPVYVNETGNRDAISGGGPVYLNETAETVTSWFEPLSDPLRKAAIIALIAPSFFAPVAPPTSAVSIGWFAPFSDPVRIQPDASRQRGRLEVTINIAPLNWFDPLAEPVRLPPNIGVANQQAYFAPVAPVIVTPPTVWLVPLSEPVRVVPNLGAPRQQAFFAPAIQPVPPQFFVPWTDPVRTKQGLLASLQQSLAETLALPNLIVNGIAFYEPWSEPTRLKPRTSDFYAAPIQQPVVVPAWFFEPLGEPTRRKWVPLTDYSIGLVSYPTPNPPVTITLTMSIQEAKDDLAEFGVYLYNAPTTAKVSVVQIQAIAGANVSIEG